MCEGRRRDQWDHTAEVLATLHNAHFQRSTGGRFRSAEFHPFLQTQQAERPLPATVAMAATLFCGPEK